MKVKGHYKSMYIICLVKINVNIISVTRILNCYCLFNFIAFQIYVSK